MEQYNFYKILSDIEIVLLGKTPAGLELDHDFQIPQAS